MSNILTDGQSGQHRLGKGWQPPTVQVGDRQNHQSTFSASTLN